ncbi:hypothetical protein HD554DRAFT_2039168 [Boletus coccyginus]|nr:hypothetical protein HD554DRAFT_2039168 [Boletus coccyginus]
MYKCASGKIWKNRGCGPQGAVEIPLLRSTSITKIVANAPQERLHHSIPISTATTTKNHPSHQNLPEGSVAQFTKIFIPLLHLYCGTLENPWSFPDHFMDKLQELWDHVMLDWLHWFDEDDNIYYLCMQKIYEWCTYIGKVGIDAIEDIWSTDPKYKNMEECQTYVEFTLGSSLPFMYGKVEYLGVNYYKTFASHLKDVVAVDNDIYHKLIGNAVPSGYTMIIITPLAGAMIVCVANSVIHSILDILQAVHFSAFSELLLQD